MQHTFYDCVSVDQDTTEIRMFQQSLGPQTAARTNLIAPGVLSFTDKFYLDHLSARHSVGKTDWLKGWRAVFTLSAKVYHDGDAYSLLTYRAHPHGSSMLWIDSGRSIGLTLTRGGASTPPHGDLLIRLVGQLYA